MSNRQEYLENLKLEVEQLCACCASHDMTVAVHEKFNGQTVWQGLVEIFNLTGHPQAQRAYAWRDVDGSERFVAVLEIPPVDSAESAVRAQIVEDVKSGHVT